MELATESNSIAIIRLFYGLWEISVGRRQSRSRVKSGIYPECTCYIYHQMTMDLNEVPFGVTESKHRPPVQPQIHNFSPLYVMMSVWNNGIFDAPQFEEVEQFCITSPNGNDSWDMHKKMIKNSEEFYQMLKLPYQIVPIVSGALNDAATKKYDLEVGCGKEVGV
ncbi:hypothetical protein LXL04_000124 [Taraxacum kok-saghyz]